MKWAFWRSGKTRVTDPGRTDSKSGDRFEQAAVDEAGARAGQASRMRMRMRRRLIGAAALLVGSAVLIPMMLDPTPRPLPDNIPIDIPTERTPFAPRLSLPAEAATAAPPAAARAPGEAAEEPPAPAPGEAGASASERKSPAAGSAAGGAPAVQADAGRWFVQAAALSSESAARELSTRLSKAGMTPFVERAESGGSVLYRVRLGPFASRDDAVKARHRLHAMGVGSNVVRVEQAQR